MQLYLSASRDNTPYMKARLAHLMHLFPWVQMVVFSELSALGPSPRTAQPLPGPAERFFQELAVQHRLWLVNGSLFELVGDTIYNTASVIDPEGRVVKRYRKMFPFCPYEFGVTSGDEFCVFDIPEVGRFGLSICYDMWFPETSRSLAALGAEVLLHPTMTTTIDRDVELSIARATAAINQCYVVDINGAGESGNGRSIIVAPAGDVVHQSGTSEELIPFEVDFDRVHRSREFGSRGLGQPLKSFRDSKVNFSVYTDPESRKFLNTLGPLAKPERGSRAGLPPVDLARGGAAPAPTAAPTPAHPAPPLPQKAAGLAAAPSRSKEIR
jgi:predicted amidohydrolase